jgi:integrase
MTKSKNTTSSTTANTWPYIKFEERKGLWRVNACTKTGGSRRYFAKEIEAIGWAEAQRELRKNEGVGAFDNSELAKFGLTVRDAIRLTLENCRREAASAPIEEVIRKLLETKKAAKRDADYVGRIEINLAKVAAYFPERLIASIATAELNQFLASLPVAPGTFNTIRADCVALWNFAEKLGVVRKNAAQDTERIREIDAPPGILTPEQVASLLVHSSDDLLAFHAIGAFAGLRVSEIHKLDWRDIKFNRGFIEVPAEKAKTKTRRLTPILPNLKAWLEPVAKAAGPICGPNLRKRHEAARKNAGITEWPDHVLRHSFCSYRLAATQNAPAVALESGHSPEILFAHYRELVHPEDAERYFNILPAPADNITSIAA